MPGHVLRPSEMQSIREHIRQIVTPAWLTSVPSNLGSAEHGKLKADQWRTLGSTYLPLSLVPLWSKASPGDERSLRCKKILDVTIALISATVIASSRTTSMTKADLYLEHMRSYILGIKELFPSYHFRPNHHMALHLHKYIVLFGPVHAWWTFPFERIIGMLQRIPTNDKIGRLASSFSGAALTIKCRSIRENDLNIFYTLCQSACPD